MANSWNTIWFKYIIYFLNLFSMSQIKSKQLNISGSWALTGYVDKMH